MLHCCSGCASSRAPDRPVCPGRRSRSSRTHQAVPRQGPWLLTPLPVQRVRDACLEGVADPPVSYTEGRAAEYASLRTGSWEVEYASTPGTVSLLPGDGMTLGAGQRLSDARAATPDQRPDIQVQGRLLDLPHVGAGGVSHEGEGCRMAILQLFPRGLRGLGCFFRAGVEMWGIGERLV